MPQWSRKEHLRLTKNFTSDEFTCKCGVCSPQLIDSIALGKLQALREEHGAPITVTSGYRCRRYQSILAARGLETAKGISSHEQGIAFDLVSADLPRLAKEAEKHFPNIGISPRFIHVDNRPGGPRRWGYKK